jgi:hypothetical protein
VATNISNRIYRVSYLALLLTTSCRPTPDPASTARVVLLAVKRAEGLTAADSASGSWTVNVAADSVDQAAVVAESLRAYLHVRSPADADSSRQSLTVHSVRATGNTLQLHYEVSIIHRCGPTWAAQYGFSGEYLATARRRAGEWQIDSVRPVIFGDPGVCSSLLVRPPPKER